MITGGIPCLEGFEAVVERLNDVWGWSCEVALVDRTFGNPGWFKIMLKDDGRAAHGLHPKYPNSDKWNLEGPDGKMNLPWDEPVTIRYEKKAGKVTISSSYFKLSKSGLSPDTTWAIGLGLYY